MQKLPAKWYKEISSNQLQIMHHSDASERCPVHSGTNPVSPEGFLCYPSLLEGQSSVKVLSMQDECISAFLYD